MGPALNAGKALFVYGDAGTGKTFITQRLARLMDDAALIPHAIAVGDAVIQMFDAAVHVPLQKPEPAVLLDDGYDARFVLCRRPLVITGGELAADMFQYPPPILTNPSLAPRCPPLVLAPRSPSVFHSRRRL